MGNEIREKILEGTEMLFMRLGIKSLTMDEICLELGVSKKTIYQHFKDKNELVQQTMQQHLQKRESRICQILQQKRNPIEELLSIQKEMAEMTKQVNPSLMHDIRRHYQEAWCMFECHKKDNILQTIFNNLTRGVDVGYYRAGMNIEIVSKMYVELVQNMLENPSFTMGDWTLPELFQELFTYHMHAILTSKGMKTYLKLTQPSLESK